MSKTNTFTHCTTETQEAWKNKAAWLLQKNPNYWILFYWNRLKAGWRFKVKMITGHSDDASKRMNSNQGLERHVSHIKMSAKQMEKKKQRGFKKKSITWKKNSARKLRFERKTMGMIGNKTLREPNKHQHQTGPGEERIQGWSLRAAKYYVQTIRRTIASEHSQSL